MGGERLKAAKYSSRISHSVSNFDLSRRASRATTVLYYSAFQRPLIEYSGAVKRRSFISCSALLGASAFSRAWAVKLDEIHSWSIAAPMPINAQELYPTVHNGKLYVAGGIASKLGVIYFTNSFFCYDPDIDKWSEETDLPENLHHAALVSSGTRLFLIGGFNGDYSHVWRMRDTVYEYVDKRWEKRASLPAPQAEGVLAANNGDIHLVTGQSPKGEANKDRSDHREVVTHLVQLAGESNWETAAPIPIACNSATGGWVDQVLILTGGRTSTGNLDHTHIYNKQEDKWRQVAPLPLPQAGTASVVVDHGIIVFGGEIFTPKAGVFKNVWRYDIRRDKWFALADLITPRHGLGAGKIGKHIYVVGGATEPSGKGTSNLNEVLTL